MKEWQVINGDSLEVLPTIPENSIDSVVTDPPYELGFMGKKWDSTGITYRVDLWQQVLRVLKPGGHLLAFSGSRTYHRMAVAIEDAGFQIRDQIMWVYGSGFPKSHNLKGDWQGWGTALKPSHEPIVMARKPLMGTVAENVQEWGTGGINVDGCRVGTLDNLNGGGYSKNFVGSTFLAYGGKKDFVQPEGRWPANLIHDGSNEATNPMGSAARFFYCAKASKKDRDEGLEGFDIKLCGLMEDDAYPIKTGSGNLRNTKRANHHPTVKPTDLMRYLCRLVTPPGGVVLDPFTGSGSTGKAATLEGFGFLGIEREAEYAEIARARIGARPRGLFA